MNIKKHIPNLFTLGNLFCGTLATLAAAYGKFEMAALFVIMGIVFDFFDGFLARILGVSGELGKQLDSLADMVTSGVAPGVVIFILINSNNTRDLYKDIYLNDSLTSTDLIGLNNYIVYLGLIVTLAACYRLAKFNIEFVKEMISNNYFLIGVTLVLSYLMNAELPLFSLKFKNYTFKDNVFKYVLILLSVVLLITVQYLAIPIIIIIYILLSIANNMMTKKTY